MNLPRTDEKPKGKNDHLAVPEINVAGKKKDHPSISDYYKAASTNDKPIQYQHGLSNYSSVQLGDDRVAFKKSLSQDMFRLDTDRANIMTVPDLAPTAKSYKQRKEDYAEANSIVGPEKLHDMEQMMRDKLQQRTKTGPFQLRKTFKYFDRDGSGGIDFSEFQRAMELMGFQFTEMQQLALFARYDESCTGEVDYSSFVEKVMESDFKGHVSSAHRKSLCKMLSSSFDRRSGNADSMHSMEDEDSDMDEEEREMFRRTEVGKLFKLVDEDQSGYIDKKEVEILLEKLNADFSQEEIDEGFSRVDEDKSGKIEFEEFYEWYKTVGF